MVVVVVVVVEVDSYSRADEGGTKVGIAENKEEFLVCFDCLE